MTNAITANTTKAAAVRPAIARRCRRLSLTGMAWASLRLAFACLGIIVLAVAGRVRPLRSSRLIAALVATLVIGVAAFLLGGDAFALAFVRLVVEHQLPEDVRADLVFSATTLAGSVAVAGTFIAFLWLLRPYALDEPA